MKSSRTPKNIEASLSLINSKYSKKSNPDKSTAPMSARNENRISPINF